MWIEIVKERILIMEENKNTIKRLRRLDDSDDETKEIKRRREMTEDGI
jgi:hypothetical protein